MPEGKGSVSASGEPPEVTIEPVPKEAVVDVLAVLAVPCYILGVDTCSATALYEVVFRSRLIGHQVPTYVNGLQQSKNNIGKVKSPAWFHKCFIDTSSPLT